MLGEIRVSDGDMPWLEGSWTPTADFEAVRPLFEVELNLVENQKLGPEWEAAYQSILDAGVQLHYPDGRPVPEFLLHIEGTRAWFRWHGEPFPMTE